MRRIADGVHTVRSVAVVHRGRGSWTGRRPNARSGRDGAGWVRGGGIVYVRVCRPTGALSLAVNALSA